MFTPTPNSSKINSNSIAKAIVVTSLLLVVPSKKIICLQHICNSEQHICSAEEHICSNEIEKNSKRESIINKNRVTIFSFLKTGKALNRDTIYNGISFKNEIVKPKFNLPLPDV